MWLILNSCGEPQISVFFLLWWASLIGPSQKINNLALDSQSLLLGSFYRLKSRTYGTGYGIKWGAIENMLGTHWELHENTLRTTKIQQPTLPLPCPKKSMGPPGCTLPHLIGCKELYRIYVFLVTFWPTLMERTWTKGAY